MRDVCTEIVVSGFSRDALVKICYIFCGLLNVMDTISHEIMQFGCKKVFFGALKTNKKQKS